MHGDGRIAWFGFLGVFGAVLLVGLIAHARGWILLL